MLRRNLFFAVLVTLLVACGTPTGVPPAAPSPQEGTAEMAYEEGNAGPTPTPTAIEIAGGGGELIFLTPTPVVPIPVLPNRIIVVTYIGIFCLMLADFLKVIDLPEEFSFLLS